MDVLSDYTLNVVTAVSNVPLFLKCHVFVMVLMVTTRCQNVQFVFSITRVAADTTY